MNDLERLRLSKGFTQVELASRAGIAVSTYSMYAHGHRAIPQKTAERIADVLGCKVEEIFLPKKFTISKSSESEMCDM